MSELRSDLLAESASGLRHLRFAREIQASLEAHAAAHGTTEQKRAWIEEAQRVARAVDALREAVKAYRDFLERVRVKSRGALRAAAYLEGPEGDGAASRAARAAHAQMETTERSPRKQAVRQEVVSLRTEIDAVLVRCERRFGATFAASLAPPVTADGQLVIDDDDGDDDATAPERC